MDILTAVTQILIQNSQHGHICDEWAVIFIFLAPADFLSHDIQSFSSPSMLLFKLALGISATSSTK
jgi:hypothetical protein